MGNPNVGKSAIFSRLTGAKVTISNYPGTTVGFTQGNIKLSEKEMGIVVDVPGVYNMEPLSRADEVAVNMAEDGDILVNVVDATNLERNLFLTLDLLEKQKPLIVVLNMWDETRHKGITIDIEKLGRELGVPVVATCGLSGEGIKELIEKIRQIKDSGGTQRKTLSRELKWEEIGRITASVQTIRHHHHTVLEVFEDISIRPLLGLPLAALVIYLSFQVIRVMGEGMIKYIFEPFFESVWMPLMNAVSGFLGGSGPVHDVIIGRLINGEIDYSASFGLLTTGLFVPFAAVLPYILSFYFILGLLEDVGYLPRLATQVDNLMHKLGLHGYAIIPMILGLGCNVPGALAIRLMENRREKFIAATLMAISVPCMAQIAMIVGLVGQRGGRYVMMIFGTLFILLVVKGLIMNRVMKGSSPEILWEIPPYRRPHPAAVAKKLWMRVSEFLKEAVPFVLLGVFVVNILYASGIIDFIARLFAPVLSGLWGLPKETISAMLIGFLRKDVAVGMLGPLGLTNKQLVIASTILAIYFPCIATFTVLVRELGAKDMAKSAVIMLITTVIVGGLMSLMLPANI
ncbi:MAG: ferrous iron transporter B [Candidatus Omnitrophica bacterium]|nr:ferrous iron transporter B [Candidatus Omnitrophota bacterium]